MPKAKQNLHGVVLLDKPTGVSSNHILQKVRWLFNAKKAGHTGSLDPLATGLLPICFGQATKVSEYLLNSDKRYSTVIKLGETTDTYDCDGDVLTTKSVDVSELELAAALEQFKGEIQQVPPMYSALKKDGQPLYKLARAGKEIERAARTMNVFDLKAKFIDKEHVELDVHCSSGFYIRSLAHDLGQVLGCGAHVVKLRRTESKSIDLSQAVTIGELEAAHQSGREALLNYLQPIDCLINFLPKQGINLEQQTALLNGQKVFDVSHQKCELTRFYGEQNQLFAIGEVTENHQLKTHKIFVLD